MLSAWGAVNALLGQSVVFYSSHATLSPDFPGSGMAHEEARTAFVSNRASPGLQALPEACSGEGEPPRNPEVRKRLSRDPKSGREDSVQIRKKIPEPSRDVRTHSMNLVEQGTPTKTAN